MPSDSCCNSSLRSSSMGSSSSLPDASFYSSSSIGSSSSSSWMGFASGLIAGVAAGAAVALVCTPLRGSDMRRKLSEYAPQVSDRFTGLLASGRCMAEDALHQATSLIEQGRQALSTSGYLPKSSFPPSVSSYSSTEPLRASVAEISGLDRRFEEPLGG